MQIRKPNITAIEAAIEFVNELWNGTRSVGKRRQREGVLYFQLVDGVKTYKVMLLGVVGWEIVEVES